MGERGKYDRTLTPAARKKAQRRALVGAATAVFARLGFAAASVEDVVSEAGASRRTFYEHFDDLAAVLAAVHDASGKLAVRYVDDAIASEPDPNARVARGIGALLELVSQNQGLARVLFGGEGRLAGRRFEERQEKLRAHFGAVLAGALADAHAHGDLERAPDAVSIIALVAGIEAVGARMALPGGPSLDDALAKLVHLARSSCS